MYVLSLSGFEYFWGRISPSILPLIEISDVDSNAIREILDMHLFQSEDASRIRTESGELLIM